MRKKHPDMVKSIEEKKQEAEDNWERLEELSDTRSVGRQAFNMIEHQ